MKTKKRPTAANRRTTSPKPPQSAVQPFAEHLLELRKRLTYIAASVLVWGGTAYAVQQHIVALLLKPSKGQNFIYTSPGGGIDFLFRVCLYAGLIISLPVIVFNILRYIEPVVSKPSRHFIAWGTTLSGILAVCGVVFGYRYGLPTALHFLLHQFTTVQIRPLVTIQSYLSFVIVYMTGSALLFQLPLLLLLINRLKPLKPSRLFHYERWVILAAFVLSGLMNPTPNIISQLFIAGPFILMYQLGIALVALANRSKNSPLAQLRAQDQAKQETRQKLPAQPMPLFESQAQPPAPAAVILQRPVSQVSRAADITSSSSSRPLSQTRAAQRSVPPLRPRKYIDGFVAPTSSPNLMG